MQPPTDGVMNNLGELPELFEEWVEDLRALRTALHYRSGNVELLDRRAQEACARYVNAAKRLAEKAACH